MLYQLFRIILVFIALRLTVTLCKIIHEYGHIWYSRQGKYKTILHIGLGESLYKNKNLSINKILFPLTMSVESEIFNRNSKGHLMCNKREVVIMYLSGMIFNFIFGCLFWGIGIFLNYTTYTNLSLTCKYIGVFNLGFFLINLIVALPPNDIFYVWKIKEWYNEPKDYGCLWKILNAIIILTLEIIIIIAGYNLVHLI